MIGEDAERFLIARPRKTGVLRFQAEKKEAPHEETFDKLPDGWDFLRYDYEAAAEFFEYADWYRNDGRPDREKALLLLLAWLPAPEVLESCGIFLLKAGKTYVLPKTWIRDRDGLLEIIGEADRDGCWLR